MNKSCIDMVVYRVKNSQDAAPLRIAVVDVLKTFDGFVSWRTLESVEDEGMFADIVEWASLEDAKAAGKAFTADPRLKDFSSAVAEMVAMTHCRQTGMVTA